MLTDTQTEFWMVNMGEPPKYDPINEGEYITLENITAAEEDNSLKYIASTYNALSSRLSIGDGISRSSGSDICSIIVAQSGAFQ